jgi:hypothetical protein
VPCISTAEFRKRATALGAFEPGKPSTTGRKGATRPVPEDLLRPPLPDLPIQRSKLKQGSKGELGVVLEQKSSDGEQEKDTPTKKSSSRSFQGPMSGTRKDVESLVKAAMIWYSAFGILFFWFHFVVFAGVLKLPCRALHLVY